jgi:hypothetical protein
MFSRWDYDADLLTSTNQFEVDKVDIGSQASFTFADSKLSV